VAANTVSVSLNQKETQALLQQVPKAYTPRLMMYCSQPWCKLLQSGQERTLLVEEGHGREDVSMIDLSRTIGWFTTIFPVVLELEEASHPSDALKAVKDQLQHPKSAMVCSAICKDGTLVFYSSSRGVQLPGSV